MAFKSALVVDDSKSARMALKGLLEEHELLVHFAESGEEALDFLKRQSVDVVFMDHTMPGMDGLEAMSAIKRNPRTAMIPVMMYTAKEGDVYVGQARALGAVGVLPKQVHPGALFDELLKLGLVKDRRHGRRARRGPEQPARRTEDRLADAEADADMDRQAVGMSVQALVTRILQDQHTELRLDILRSHRDFARQVAAEILEQQRAHEAAEPMEEPVPELPPERGFGAGALALVAVLCLLPAAWLGSRLAETRDELDELTANADQANTTTDQRLVAAETETSDLLAQLDAEQRRADTRYLGLLGALEWAINQSSGIPYGQQPLNDTRLERLRDLMNQLAAVDFRGTIRLDVHLGEFCLVSDASGEWQLADPELAVIDCSMIGHPLDQSVSVNDVQSVSFANFLASSPLVSEAGIEVQVVAHGRQDSVRRFAFPSSIRTAGEWNAIAARNNRIEYTLLPESP